jgi:hypothetical protein
MLPGGEWTHIGEGFMWDGTWIENTTFVIVLCSAIIIFAYWYRKKGVSKQMKTPMALLLVGFMFTPMMKWWLYILRWPDYITRYDYFPGFVESILINMVALYLIYTGYKIWKADPDNNRRELYLMAALTVPNLLAVVFFALPRGMVNNIPLESFGFAIVRPICFAVAILKFRMFNINLTKKVIIYTSIALLMGLAFFQVKNFFQSTLPALGFLSIIIVSLVFLPLAALSNYVAQALTPKIHALFGQKDEPDDEVKTPFLLVDSFKEVLQPNKLVFVLGIGICIEIIETGVNTIIKYPVLLSVLFVGILFSAMDYIVDLHFQGSEDKAEASKN